MTLLLIASALWQGQSAAQTTNQFGAKPSAPAKAVEIEQITTASAVPVPALTNAERLAANASTGATAGELPTEVGASGTPQPQFRIERLPMIGGAELLTIFGRLDGMRSNALPAPEVPLVSVVRDTLSDNDPPIPAANRGTISFG